MAGDGGATGIKADATAYIDATAKQKTKIRRFGRMAAAVAEWQPSGLDQLG